MTKFENEIGTSIQDIDVKDKFENNEACDITDYRIDQVKDDKGNQLREEIINLLFRIDQFGMFKVLKVN